MTTSSRWLYERKRNRGPAFPIHNHGTQTLGMHVTGMTLRQRVNELEGFQDEWRKIAKHHSGSALSEAQKGGCELGCTKECKAKAEGCASECPALPWQPDCTGEHE